MSEGLHLQSSRMELTVWQVLGSLSESDSIREWQPWVLNVRVSVFKSMCVFSRQNLLGSSGWPRTRNPPASASLGLQICVSTLSFWMAFLNEGIIFRVMTNPALFFTKTHHKVAGWGHVTRLCFANDSSIAWHQSNPLLIPAPFYSNLLKTLKILKFPLNFAFCFALRYGSM